MMSDDDGLTWGVNVKLNDYRIYDIIWTNGYFYATGYNWSSVTGYQWQLWWSNDGLAWTQFAGVQPHRHQRLTAHGTDVVTVNVQRTHLIVVSGDTVTSYALPATFREIVFNAIASVDGVLFFADAIGKIWRTTDYQNWTQYSYVPNAISLGHWPSQACLVVSDMGANAKLWKIAL